jgi:hypothetical protein
MKRANAIIAIVLAAALVGGGMWALSHGKGEDLPHDDEPGTDLPDVPGNLTDPIFSVPHPVDIKAGEEKLSLELSYPGQGYAGTEYAWNEEYEFVLRTSGSGWDGRAVIKVFAERAESIGAKCIVITYGENGTVASWMLKTVHGNNHLSADTVVWLSNGTDDRTDRFSVLFNRTGTFNVTFQAFDADSGEPLSAPVSAADMEVPAAGELNIRALGGEWREVENTTYFVVLLNVTNEWNVRHSIDAAYLTLSSDGAETRVSENVTSFTTQELAPGQSAQFQAFFLIEEGAGDIELIYAEPERTPVNVPLPA